MSYRHTVGYYAPTILDVENTTPYRHADIIATAFDTSVLITERPPPVAIAERFSEVYVVGNSSHESPVRNLAALPSTVWEALSLVNRELGSTGTLVTAVGRKATATGFLSRPTWIADVYDDPIQSVFEHPSSNLFAVDAKLRRRLLTHADCMYLSLHPAVGLRSRHRTIFGMNGAPVDRIRFERKPPRDPLRVLVAGKIRPDEGMPALLHGVERTSAHVRVDLFGDHGREETERLADSLGVREAVTFHGRVPHEEILDYVSAAHVGVCLLPPRSDWIHAYPIKVGEYLASGTIPLVSPLPGMQQMVDDTGLCVDLSPEEIATSLETVSEMPRFRFDTKSAACRNRAEEIAWQRQQQRFVDSVRRVASRTARSGRST